MNDQLRAAAQAILDRWDSPKWEWATQGPTADLMAELRAALAQQAERFCDTHCTWLDHAPGCVRAEPVGTVRVDAGEVHIVPLVRDADRSALKDGQSVYAAPPQRKFVPLTVDEIERIWRDGGGVGRPSIGLIRAIEQALKEQNR